MESKETVQNDIDTQYSKQKTNIILRAMRATLREANRIKRSGGKMTNEEGIKFIQTQIVSHKSFSKHDWSDFFGTQDPKSMDHADSESVNSNLKE